MTTIKEFAKYINRAHGDGFDNVEIPIEKARELLSKLEIADKALERLSTEMPGSRNNELVLHRERLAKETLEAIRE